MRERKASCFSGMQAVLLFCFLFLYPNTISPRFNLILVFMLSPFHMFKFAYCFVLMMFGGTCKNHHCLSNNQTECTSCCMLLIIRLRLISLTFYFVSFVRKKSISSHKCEKTSNDLIHDMVNKVLYIHFSHCLVCPISTVTILEPWPRKKLKYRS